MFKIATWNVNSLRVRLQHLLDWLTEHQPDVIALQEIKLEEKDFPYAQLKEIGYECVASGQKTYNGVALLSRLPIQDVQTDIVDYNDPQRRILMATIGNFRIVNLYIPNGSSVGSEKYQYKLEWLEKVTQELTAQYAKYKNVIVLGDFNIAPHDDDVHDPALWQGQVHVSDLERAALQNIMALKFHDAFRLFEKAAGFYSWWDYRAGGYRRNHGLRIDHIFISDALVPHCQNCYIEKSPRALERPSDHVPVVAEFLCPTS